MAKLENAATVAATVESPVVVESAQELVPVTSLIGLDYDKLVGKLRSRPDFKAFDNMKVLNITFGRDSIGEDGRPSGNQVSITVGTKLPQYLQSDVVEEVDEDGYALSTSTTIFTSAIQIAAILKQLGRIQFATAVIKNPLLIASILEGARVSVFGKEYAKGDVEQSPFSSNINEYVMEHRSIRYYMYDIVLGKGAAMLDNALANLMAQQIMGM